MAPGETKGSCACGDVTFETDALPFNATCCYCRECAKVSGAGFLTFVHVRPDDLKWSRTPDIWKSSEVAERWYCGRCGSSVGMNFTEDPDEVSIVITMIESSRHPLPTVERHLFVAEKADWVVIPDDGAKRFNGHDPAFQAQFDEWKNQAKEIEVQGQAEKKK